MSRIDRKPTWEAKRKAFWLVVAGEIQKTVANRFALSLLTDNKWWGKGKGATAIAERKRLLRSTKLTEMWKNVLSKSLSKKKVFYVEIGCWAYSYWVMGKVRIMFEDL